MKLADLKKKRRRELAAARKLVEKQLGAHEKQALKALAPLVKAIAQIQKERTEWVKAASANQTELKAAWTAALKQRRLVASIFDQGPLMGEDEEPGLTAELETSFDWLDFPDVDAFRSALEEAVAATFQALREKADANFEDGEE